MESIILWCVFGEWPIQKGRDPYFLHVGYMNGDKVLWNKYSVPDTFSVLILHITMKYFHDVHFAKCRTKRMEEFQIDQMTQLMYSIPILGLQVSAWILLFICVWLRSSIAIFNQRNHMIFSLSCVRSWVQMLWMVQWISRVIWWIYHGWIMSGHSLQECPGPLFIECGLLL